MKNENDNGPRRLSPTADVNAPIGHSWDLVDRRVIELWLGSQSGVSLPAFGPADELRGVGLSVEPGT